MDVDGVSENARSIAQKDLSAQADLIEKIVQSVKSELAEHLLQSILRVDRAHIDHQKSREEETNDILVALQRQISELKDDLAQELVSREKAQQGLVDFQTRVAEKLVRVRSVYSSATSLYRVFHAWHKVSKRGVRCRRFGEALEKSEDRYLMFKYFAKFCKQHRQAIHGRLVGEVNFKYETLNETMVARYEADMTRLRSDLNDAYSVIKREELKRIQLEDEVKRLLLKNMTAMNMEALAIFKSVNSARSSASVTPIPGDEVLKAENSGQERPASTTSQEALSSMEATEGPAAIAFERNGNEDKRIQAPTGAGALAAHSSSNDSAAGLGPSNIVHPTAAHLDRLSEMYRQSLAASSKLTRPAGAAVGRR